MNWFRFGNPDLLIFLWLGFPIILLLLLFGLRQKRKVTLLFQSNVNLSHLKRQKLHVALLILCYLFLVIAIANPQWGVKPETVAERLDIMLALDISTSMLATDGNSVRRLTNAKEVIFSLLEQLEGDRVGLLYFAEASVVVCPLTNDVNTLKEFLDALTPETIVHRGTHIGNAIGIASARLTVDEDKLTTTDIDYNGQKVLILFTDGEDHGEGVITAAHAAKKKGIHIYCVGVGTSNKLVPIPLALEGTGYKRDIRGQLVLTKLNDEGLDKIATAGNGYYYHANEGIRRLLDDISRLEKQKYRIRTDGEYQVRYQWFVLSAMILLVCELLLQRWKIRRDR